MKNTNLKVSLTALTMLAAAAFLAPHAAQAHCDGLDGPVVKAAQKALAEGNVNHVLIWVQKDDSGDDPEPASGRTRPHGSHHRSGSENPDAQRATGEDLNL